MWENYNGVISSNGYYLNYNSGWRLSAAANSYISDGNGNYLRLNSGGSLTNATSIGSATLWTFQNASGSGRISAQVGGTTYYLYYNSGLYVTTSQSQATSWANHNGYIHYNGNFIRYNGSTWTTTTVSNYYISDTNGNYLSLSGSTLFNATSKEDATVWTFSNGFSGGIISSGNRYLRYTSGNLTTSTSRSTNWTMANNRIYTGSTYIKCNNGVWSASTGTTNATLLVFPSQYFTALISNSGSSLSLTQTTAKT